MHMLLSRACNPPLALRSCIRRWRDIAGRLREAPRLRTYQSEVDWA